MSSFNQQIVTKCLPLAPLCDIKVNVMVSVPNLQVILDMDLHTACETGCSLVVVLFSGVALLFCILFLLRRGVAV